MVTRGVLLDMPRALGVPYLEPGFRVTPSELESAERLSGSGPAAATPCSSVPAAMPTAPCGARISPTGRLRGLSASCLPWIKERGIALLGSDVAHDAMPSPSNSLAGPIHSVGIVGMGLWLLDNAYLDDLATAAAEASGGNSVALGPLKLKRGTGSPVNPLAVL